MVRRRDIARRVGPRLDTVRLDGASMILLLFAAALVVGVLAGLGVRSLQRSAAVRSAMEHAGTPLPAEAAGLGYRTEQAFAADRDMAAEALEAVLNDGPGAQRLWENAETGNRGVIWAAAATMQPNGVVCRSLARRTLINNAYRNAEAQACRNPTGQWEGGITWTID